jgi:hypothetical protein
MSSDVETAKRGFGLGRSRAEAFQMRRFAQDSMMRPIWRLPHHLEDAQIGHIKSRVRVGEP